MGGSPKILARICPHPDRDQRASGQLWIAVISPSGTLVTQSGDLTLSQSTRTMRSTASTRKFLSPAAVFSDHHRPADRGGIPAADNLCQVDNRNDVSAQRNHALHTGWHIGCLGDWRCFGYLSTLNTLMPKARTRRGEQENSILLEPANFARVDRSRCSRSRPGSSRNLPRLLRCAFRLRADGSALRPGAAGRTSKRIRRRRPTPPRAGSGRLTKRNA